MAGKPQLALRDHTNEYWCEGLALYLAVRWWMGSSKNRSLTLRTRSEITPPPCVHCIIDYNLRSIAKSFIVLRVRLKIFLNREDRILCALNTIRGIYFWTSPKTKGLYILLITINILMKKVLVLSAVLLTPA